MLSSLLGLNLSHNGLSQGGAQQREGGKKKSRLSTVKWRFAGSQKGEKKKKKVQRRYIRKNENGAERQDKHKNHRQ